MFFSCEKIKDNFSVEMIHVYDNEKKGSRALGHVCYFGIKVNTRSNI